MFVFKPCPNITPIQTVLPILQIPTLSILDLGTLLSSENIFNNQTNVIPNITATLHARGEKGYSKAFPGFLVSVPLIRISRFHSLPPPHTKEQPQNQTRMGGSVGSHPFLAGKMIAAQWPARTA